jgi:hypothetical protein
MPKPATDTTPNEISAFFHCKTCLAMLPDGMSPREWIRIEVGWTEKGLQVWCTRCEKNIISLDFMGQKVGIV